MFCLDLIVGHMHVFLGSLSSMLKSVHLTLCKSIRQFSEKEIQRKCRKMDRKTNQVLVALSNPLLLSCLLFLPTNPPDIFPYVKKAPEAPILGRSWELWPWQTYQMSSGHAGEVLIDGDFILFLMA